MPVRGNAINNVRVITSTYIQDAEEGLIVDGTTIKPTYTVKAIGNPQELSNAVDIAGGVGAQLQVKYGPTSMYSLLTASLSTKYAKLRKTSMQRR